MGREEEIAELEREVAAEPRRAGARLRLGLALSAAGRLEEGASELQLAARLEPGSPEVALIAVSALVRVGRAREAALLLSVHVRERRAATRLSGEERALVEGLLQHEESFVRCHTARAVGRLRLVDVADAVERLARLDPDGAVRLAAEASHRLLGAH